MRLKTRTCRIRLRKQEYEDHDKIFHLNVVMMRLESIDIKCDGGLSMKKHIKMN